MKLQKEWEKRLKLHIKADKLCEEGNKLAAERVKFGVSDKLYVKGDKLYEKGCKLYAKGNELWAEAVLKVYGNIKMEWKNWDETYNLQECHLENGEVYGF